MPDNDIRPTSMGRPLIIYAGAFVPLALIAYGLRLASLNFLGEDILLPFAPIIVLAIAGHAAGTSFARQAGCTATWGYSLVFGLISAILIVTGMLAVWLLGGQVPYLPEIGPVGINSSMMARALSTLLVTGEVCMLFTTVVFRGSADAAHRKRRAKLAATAAT
ncbi:hypothetical protein [Paracoccus xiamenensis]|uniref:hypothetical protein n=1 Tax=Paracoccus xiamenensis TaxID=2714901 RepID=UPI00140AE33E|nr:hypothetical protein [Paracoccus xiamenensis]NHF74147.1 hypothetical protein [Paracoccus xiamenensis]